MKRTSYATLAFYCDVNGVNGMNNVARPFEPTTCKRKGENRMGRISLSGDLRS